MEVVGATKKLLERAADAKVKLIILDLGAPGLNVAELLPQLKQANESAAVVAYAPHVHEDKLTAAQDAGCDEVLVRGQFNQQIDALLAKYLDE